MYQKSLKYIIKLLYFIFKLSIRINFIEVWYVIIKFNFYLNKFIIKVVLNYTYNLINFIFNKQSIIKYKLKWMFNIYIFIKKILYNTTYFIKFNSIDSIYKTFKKILHSLYYVNYFLINMLKCSLYKYLFYFKNYIKIDVNYNILRVNKNIIQNLKNKIYSKSISNYNYIYHLGYKDLLYRLFDIISIKNKIKCLINLKFNYKLNLKYFLSDSIVYSKIELFKTKINLINITIIKYSTRINKIDTCISFIPHYTKTDYYNMFDIKRKYIYVYILTFHKRIDLRDFLRYLGDELYVNKEASKEVHYRMNIDLEGQERDGITFSLFSKFKSFLYYKIFNSYIYFVLFCVSGILEYI